MQDVEQDSLSTATVATLYRVLLDNEREYRQAKRELRGADVLQTYRDLSTELVELIDERS